MMEHENNKVFTNGLQEHSGIGTVHVESNLNGREQVDITRVVTSLGNGKVGSKIINKIWLRVSKPTSQKVREVQQQTIQVSLNSWIAKGEGERGGQIPFPFPPPNNPAPH